jgi:hypothetical protein
MLKRLAAKYSIRANCAMIKILHIKRGVKNKECSFLMFRKLNACLVSKFNNRLKNVKNATSFLVNIVA